MFPLSEYMSQKHLAAVNLIISNMADKTFPVHSEVSINGGIQKWMVFKGASENKMNDLGAPL